MGYFDTPLNPPDLPVPQDLQLWDDGTGSYTLTWRSVLGVCDGYVIFAGVTPMALSEVARVPNLARQRGTLRHWPVPPGLGRWLAVACYRGASVGVVSVATPMGEEPDTVTPPEVVVSATHAAEEPLLPVAPAPPADALPPDTPLCECCAPPQALLPQEGRLCCALTGEAYVALATGEFLRVAELPYGLCSCCDPAQPLIRCAGAIVCLARADQEYVRVAGSYVPRQSTPAASPLADAEAIDAALRANSALLGLNGLFVTNR